MWVVSRSVRTGFAGSRVSMTATPWSSKDPRYATWRDACAATFEYWPLIHGAKVPTRDMDWLAARDGAGLRSARATKCARRRRRRGFVMEHSSKIVRGHRAGRRDVDGGTGRVLARRVPDSRRSPILVVSSGRMLGPG